MDLGSCFFPRQGLRIGLSLEDPRFSNVRIHTHMCRFTPCQMTPPITRWFQWVCVPAYICVFYR